MERLPEFCPDDGELRWVVARDRGLDWRETSTLQADLYEVVWLDPPSRAKGVLKREPFLRSIAMNMSRTPISSGTIWFGGFVPVPNTFADLES